MDIKGYVLIKKKNNNVKIISGKIFEKFSDACKFMGEVAKDFTNYSYDIKQISLNDL